MSDPITESLNNKNRTPCIRLIDAMALAITHGYKCNMLEYLSDNKYYCKESDWNDLCDL